MFLRILTVTVILLKQALAGCQIDLDQRTKPNPPMILNTDGDMIYPTTGRTLLFGNILELAFLHLSSIKILPYLRYVDIV